MLELQLADLKLQQHQERSTQEQTQMQLYAEQVTQLLTTEKNLRLQLSADGEKFQQFQVHFLFEVFWIIDFPCYFLACWPLKYICSFL